jgi:hypothetical protein
MLTVMREVNVRWEYGRPEPAVRIRNKQRPDRTIMADLRTHDQAICATPEKK